MWVLLSKVNRRPSPSYLRRSRHVGTLVPKAAARRGLRRSFLDSRSLDEYNPLNRDLYLHPDVPSDTEQALTRHNSWPYLMISPSAFYSVDRCVPLYQTSLIYHRLSKRVIRSLKLSDCVKSCREGISLRDQFRTDRDKLSFPGTSNTTVRGGAQNLFELW